MEYPKIMLKIVVKIMVKNESQRNIDMYTVIIMYRVKQ